MSITDGQRVNAFAARCGHSLHRFRRDCAGNVVILAAVAMPVLVGAMGLGAEVGYWYVVKRELQHAADVSAHAAAIRKRAGDDKPSIDAVALRIATEAGYEPAIGTIDINSPPVSGPNAGSSDMVEVIVNEPVDRLFSGIFIDGALRLKGRAVATVMPGSPACVLALSGKNKNTDQALSLEGSTDLKLVGCDIASNSVSTSAFHMQGGAKLSSDCAFTAGEFAQTGGTVSIDLPVCGNIRERYFPVSDPYKDIVEPTPAAPCQNGNIGQPNQTTTVTPTGVATVDGVTVPAMHYCSLTLQGNVIFQPGVYIVKGDMKSTGGSITGDGATFYVKGNVDISGNVTIKLTAPTTGPLGGLVFFGARDAAASTHKINGNSGSEIQGGVYFPAGHVSFTGSSAAVKGCTQVVADTVTFSGNSMLKSECDGAGTREILARGPVRLIE